METMPKMQKDREPEQGTGHTVSWNKSSKTIQRMVDMAPKAEVYCTDGYSGYLDVVFPENHIYNIHNKNDTFTAESVNADLRHYIPTLARRSRYFPRKLENLQAFLVVFVRAYNRCWPSKTSLSFPPSRGFAIPFLYLTSFNCAFGYSLIFAGIDFSRRFLYDIYYVEHLLYGTCACGEIGIRSRFRFCLFIE